MMVLLMVVCRMLPISFAEDKTLEISFVPVLACAITGGAPLAVVLFGVSTLFTVMQNPAAEHYYWPLAREPRKELFNTGNILVSISAGGLPLLLAGMPDNLASLPALGLSLLFAALCILVNLTLFILYYQVGGMGQFGTLMRQNIGGLLPNIIATVPLGLLLGIVINMPNSYFYIVLFMAPLMLARYSFKLYLDSKSMHMRTIAALSIGRGRQRSLHPGPFPTRSVLQRGHCPRHAQISQLRGRRQDGRAAARRGQNRHRRRRAQQARRAYGRGIRADPAASW